VAGQPRGPIAAPLYAAAVVFELEEPMSQEEREYYRAGDVLVTNTRAGLGGRTFAMANITAVSMGTRVNSLRGCAFVLLYVGVVLAVVALAAGGSGGVAGFLGGAAGFLVGLLIVWLVYG
jgi:hypothetical protein